jgi:bifunctional non-homologous end joining protein LigD
VADRRAQAPPTGSDAMKALLTDEREFGEGWIFERKLDGIRAIGVRDGSDARLLSRNDLSLNGRYPEVAEALGRQPAKRIAVDGEVVAFAGSQTSFARLARRGRERVAIHYYVFDLLWLDGRDVRPLPLRERKRLLRDVMRYDNTIRFTPHRNANYLDDACRKGWEGLIAKRADSPYISGKRSRDWLKLKCEQGQELVIGGYTAPKGLREELGALLLGYFEDGNLRYAGKVGTGFDRETLRDLARRLAPLRREASPFSDEVPARATTWVEPELVAQVGFTEWTRDGRLRHPRFLGLRDDKAAREVVRE